MSRRNGPALWQGEEDIARIVGRGGQAKSGVVPMGAGIRKVEAAAPGKTELECREGLISGIFELIDTFNSNDGLRSRNELNVDLLFDNSVARAERSRTAGSAINGAGQQELCTKSAPGFQSATIVARETD